MLFNIVYFPEKKDFEFEGGLKARAYYDPNEKIVFIAGSRRIRVIVYLHECVHAVRDRLLPECVGIYFDILFDLFDTLTTVRCYKEGLIKHLKETWRDYRIQGEELEEDVIE